VKDIALVLERLREKDVVDVEISFVDGFEPGYEFEFEDSEKQDCKIKVFPSQSNTTPDWITKKKLYSKQKK
jgi:hypothetical protein